MRVLLISGEYPPYMFGGGATFMYNLSRGLTSRGLDVTVVSMKFSKRFTKEIETEEIGSRLRILRIPIPAYLYPRHDVFQIVARPLLSKLIKEHDVVHMNTGLYYPFLRDVIRESKRPAIVTIHNDLIMVYKVSLNLSLSPSEVVYGLLHMSEAHTALKKELKELYPVFVSRSLYETMKTKYEIHSYSIIYNGLDFDYIDKAIASNPKTEFYNIIMNAKKSGYKILVYPARLHPIKNHYTLIKILRILLQKYKTKILLVLTSEGISRNSIIKLVNKLGISRNVLLTGRLPYDETLRILSLADAVPYVSLYEACPIALVEALYLGKLAVAFNLPYVREIVDVCTSSGVSCRIRLVDNVKRFIEELHDALINDVPNSKRRIFIERFSVNHMRDEYITLYKKALVRWASYAET